MLLVNLMTSAEERRTPVVGVKQQNLDQDHELERRTLDRIDENEVVRQEIFDSGSRPIWSVVAHHFSR